MRKIIVVIAVCLILPLGVLAAENSQDSSQTPPQVRPSVRIFNSADFQLKKEFFPFAADSKAEGVNITTDDLNQDGQKEIIVSTGRNEKPLVKIFNYNGDFLYDFLAYKENFKSGFKAITADLYNDGSPEIITAPYEGGSPQIRVFDRLGYEYFSFYAFDAKENGGASVSVGDVNGDTQKEIIVGAGYGNEPVVKIFDNYSNYILEFYAYEKSFKGGINVLAIDLNNDKIDEIVTAPYLGKEGQINVFNQYGNLIYQFLAYPKEFAGGVNLAKSDIDQDGKLEILTGSGFGAKGQMKIFDGHGIPKINSGLTAYDNFNGGISVSSGDIDNDKRTELLAATQTISPLNRYESYKIIEIDLAKQQLYSYFKGAKDNTFIISSGKNGYPTPIGSFKILRKTPLARMRGYYGPNDPNNYDLPNVPNIMPFYKGYAIHGAYWHWKFGTRVSHGCVNLKLPDAKTLFSWADVGTPVNIYSSAKKK